MNRPKGERRSLRNLKFTLSQGQLCEVTIALEKLNGAHHARVAWFDDCSLDGNVLSIHALDLISVLSHCQRDPENEMDLFRLRKAATDELASRLEKTQDEIKRQNIRMWLESYQKLWVGEEAHKDLSQAPSQNFAGML